MGGLIVDDRYEEVLRQYDFCISNVYRARGALLLETDKGVKLIRMSDSSKARIEYENRIMSYLQEQGYPDIDIYYPNRENELIRRIHKEISIRLRIGILVKSVI